MSRESWKKAIGKDEKFNKLVKEMNPHGFYKKIRVCKKCGSEYGSDISNEVDDGFCPPCVPHKHIILRRILDRAKKRGNSDD